MRRPNFSAGPAALPEAVLQQIREDLPEWGGRGASVMELSHRGEDFMALAANSERRLRSLMDIPDSHAVLFMQGGATGQAALIPMNFAPARDCHYFVEAHWGEVALKQARAVARASSGPFEDRFDHRCAYVHYTSNETIHGLQRRQPPQGPSPVVGDMSSDILSYALDWSGLAIAYAGAQKNLGPSGISIVVIDRDLLATANESLPPILNYANHAARDSMLNTPPTFAWYVLDLMLQWIEAQGGLPEMARRSLERSQMIYEVIDESPVFRNEVPEGLRSRMNVVFELPDEESTTRFLAQAQEAGFIGLRGHRARGGCRASMYNACPVEHARDLAAFMRDFAQRAG